MVKSQDLNAVRPIKYLANLFGKIVFDDIFLQRKDKKSRIYI